MADPIKDGGPAFPNVPDGAGDRWASWDMGMTLRDYFAAKAMAALLPTVTEFPDEHWRVGVALNAYAMADAMLRARENGNG